MLKTTNLSINHVAIEVGYHHNLLNSTIFIMREDHPKRLSGTGEIQIKTDGIWIAIVLPSRRFSLKQASGNHQTYLPGQ
ncbi:hypothetical protein CFK37_18315 [Virgibacillus phasianinus]|uniref:Uncharacterized protein n=1 Tax=Virgibacillus phasianinus TaxID=2017483 RepID=A0A220U7Y1_9BACI|nr:hypothetical protein CFK37_18315 [Virgibacillus phasianinus]